MKFFDSSVHVLRVVGIWLFSAALGWAHNPDSSWATVRVVGDTIELKVEMATESAWHFLGNSRDSAPNIDHSMPKLRAAAANVYRLSVGDRILTPKETSVERSEEDGVQFRLHFSLPKGDAAVRFEPGHLKRMSKEHRTTLTLLDEADNVLRGEILNAKKTSVEMKLPSPSPVPAAK